eukprot:13680552-Ditylum_brightwellii.AAC.2
MAAPEEANKTTSSSPYGCHHGYYKVLNDHEDVLEFHCIMMTLRFKYRFTPQCWMKSVDVMLKKDPGSPKLHCL